MRMNVNTMVAKQMTTVRNMKTESVWLCLQRTFSCFGPFSSIVFLQYPSFVFSSLWAQPPFKISMLASDPVYGNSPDPYLFLSLVSPQFLPRNLMAIIYQHVSQFYSAALAAWVAHSPADNVGYDDDNVY
jgi:hypothetical protein